MQVSKSDESARSGREVPAYDIHQFQARQTRYAVLIPVLNEADRLRNQLRKMEFLSGVCDIVIGDGASTDGSGDPERIKNFGVRTLLIKRGPGKLSAQLRMLLDYGLNQGYDGFVLVDGNGKDGVEAIPAFLEALASGYDYIQGSRYIEGGVERNTPWDRKLGVALFHAPLLSLAAGFRYTDTTNGFRALSRRVLLDPRVQPFRDVFDTYNLHYYLSVRIPRLGYRVMELPVRREYPRSGPLPSKIGGIRSKLHIIRLVVLAALGKYNPAKGAENDH
ncbi:MAG TPA: glycosyltransferase family 2 protein [Bryobacteraceae bacterium]|nr:glycosyltransferase family 2 protein [Bryobacteraceae bacterium]